MARDIKKLICPKCHTYWADFDYTDYPNLSSKHLKVLAGNRRKLKDGQSLECSCCSYPYTTWDIVIAGADTPQEGLQPGERKDIP